MAKNVSDNHKKWQETPGRNNKPHSQNTTMRTVPIPPATDHGWDLSQYENKWNLILEKLSN